MVLTEKGYNRPTYSDILDQQIERAKLLFGEDIETDEKTPLGKYIRINVQDIAELHEILETVYYARFPDSATGQSLDRLLPFAGITRNQASYAKHKIKFTGTAGETIPGGFLVAAGELQFYTLEDYLIGDGGTITGFVYPEIPDLKQSTQKSMAGFRQLFCLYRFRRFPPRQQKALLI